MLSGALEVAKLEGANVRPLSKPIDAFRQILGKFFFFLTSSIDTQFYPANPTIKLLVSFKISMDRECGKICQDQNLKTPLPSILHTKKGPPRRFP